MLSKSRVRGFSVIWIDLQGCVHSKSKPISGALDCFAGVVASGVADDCQTIAEFVYTVGNQHQMFLPVHQMTFSGGSADNQALHTIFNLCFNQKVIAFKVNISVQFIRSFDCGHQTRRFYFFHFMMLIVPARKAVCYLIFPGFLQKTHAAKVFKFTQFTLISRNVQGRQRK